MAEYGYPEREFPKYCDQLMQEAEERFGKERYAAFIALSEKYHESFSEEDGRRCEEERLSFCALLETLQNNDKKYLELEAKDKLYFRNVHKEAQRQVDQRKIATKKQELEAKIQLGLKRDEALVKLDREEKKIWQKSEEYFQQFSSCEGLMMAERRMVDYFVQHKWAGLIEKEEQQKAEFEAKLGKALEAKLQLDNQIARSKPE